MTRAGPGTPQSVRPFSTGPSPVLSSWRHQPLTVAMWHLLSVERTKERRPDRDCRPRQPPPGEGRSRSGSPSRAGGDAATVSASSGPGRCGLLPGIVAWGGVLVLGGGLDGPARAAPKRQGLQRRDPDAARRAGSGHHDRNACGQSVGHDHGPGAPTARSGVFDPQGLATGVPSALRWSPVRGCERPQTAMIRANALCADARRGDRVGSFLAATDDLGGAVPAARRGPRGPDPGRPLPLVALTGGGQGRGGHSRPCPRAALAWDKALDAIVSADQRQRDSVWAMVANAFAALADPECLDAVSPGPGELFDPATFLRQRGTLYLIGTASGASATAGLVAALVEDVVDVARRLAAGSTGARLDPPLGLILDEAANYPLPSLGALMSEGGGTGITTLAALQSLAQARHRWGREQAQGIWDSAIVKIVLGGGGQRR